MSSWIYIGRKPFEPLGLAAFSEVIPTPSTLPQLVQIKGLLLTKEDFRIWLARQLVSELASLCRTYGMDPTNPRQSFRERTGTKGTSGSERQAKVAQARSLANDGESWAAIGRALNVSAPTAKKLATIG